MFKPVPRILIAIVMAAALLVPAVPVRAEGTTSTDERSVSEIILSGLWAGVNFTFGGSSSSTTTTSTPTTSRPANGQTQQPNTPPVPPTAGAYVALGDSVAAGVGLPTVLQVPAGETRCGRTGEAYPHEVARAMSLPLIHKACSGATAGDLFTKQRSGSPNLAPQLDAAFTGGNPELITITAGANDTHWERFLTTCRYSDCATSTQTTLANGYLLALQGKLVYLFGDIRSRSGGVNPPTVVITGYYNPVSSSCTTQFENITAEEIYWMTGMVDSLNQTIEDVADLYPFVRFAPVDFTGHDLCSADPWIQGLSDPRPIHPTTEGQSVIANSVLRSLGR